MCMMIAVPFQKHCSVIICGASASGKTNFVVECIKQKENIFNGCIPKEIHYFYGIYQPIFNSLESNYNVKCHYGVPTEADIDLICSNGCSNMIILDDLMDALAKNTILCTLFTQGCHHRKLCVFFITQNLYYGGKRHTTVCRNAQYYVFTRSPANSKAVHILCSQLFEPGKAKKAMECYKDIMTRPYAIMLLDTHPATCDEFPIRTDIFKDTIFYKI